MCNKRWKTFSPTPTTRNFARCTFFPLKLARHVTSCRRRRRIVVKFRLFFATIFYIQVSFIGQPRPISEILYTHILSAAKDHHPYPYHSVFFSIRFISFRRIQFSFYGYSTYLPILFYTYTPYYSYIHTYTAVHTILLHTLYQGRSNTRYVSF